MSILFLSPWYNGIFLPFCVVEHQNYIKTARQSQLIRAVFWIFLEKQLNLSF
jgi:hypothetical protein